ncbi:MAG: hypothetical protein II404_11265 [Prevotella sp.]|nr:hypothetical protein [Prevotella sp.]
MLDVRNTFFCLMLCTMMLSCTAVDDVPGVDNSEQEPNLVLSIGKTKTLTRQGLDVIQDEGQTFRGLKGLLVIPFATDDDDTPVASDDMPLISVVSGNQTNKVDGRYYYYMDKCNLTRGTNRVLVYGQAATISGKESADKNGQLNTTLKGRMLPADITFSLQSIRETYDVDPSAQALASYMTAIANTTDWSTTDNAQLKGLYLDFINAKSDGTGLMGGSAAHVKAYVEALKEQLTTIKNAGGTATDIVNLCTDIISNIDNNSNIESNTYPRSIGLPDGAAALRWTGSAFTVRTQATTLDNINGITRWTYPAELWYYANSGILTSEQDVAKTTYASQTQWSSLLNGYYKAGKTVTGGTKSVAVEQPLQYGVSRMQLTLNKITGTLSDAKEQNVSYEASQFPLKAVIIGGQHTVGFDFKPLMPQSDVDASFIYDTVVGSPDTNGKYTVNTLVLQTYDDEKVPIVLEFENKTNQSFTGKDGIIYPDTKFYLIAQIDPDNGLNSNAETQGRVFTQDYTTTMTMNVTSLANAYSCMPDLLSPRLEIGVQVTTTWIQPTTTTVIL